MTEDIRQDLINKLVQAGLTAEELADMPTIRLIDALYEKGYEKGFKRGGEAITEAESMDWSN